MRKIPKSLTKRFAAIDKHMLQRYRDGIQNEPQPLSQKIGGYDPHAVTAWGRMFERVVLVVSTIVYYLLVSPSFACDFCPRHDFKDVFYATIFYGLTATHTSRKVVLFLLLGSILLEALTHLRYLIS